MDPPFFSSRFGSTAGAGLFVKRAKNGFGSAEWLTAVDALNSKIEKLKKKKKKEICI